MDHPFDDSNTNDGTNKVSVYLDNATIINACTILTNPKSFDPYKLLDFESFCEAFLLYDEVYTLIGRSFRAGIGRYPGEYFIKPGTMDDLVARMDPAAGLDAAASSDLFTASLDFGAAQAMTAYSDLVNRKILKPVTVSASNYENYSLKNLDFLDGIASSINVEQTIKQFTKIFGKEIPWMPPRTLDRPDKRKSKEAWRNLIHGEYTVTHGTDPRYYFRKSKSKQGQDHTEEHYDRLKNRRTTAVEEFISQTFYYIVEAARERTPYICSSIRLPIVRDMTGQLHNRFVSIVHGCLGMVESESRTKIKAILQFLGDGSIRFLFLPALICILNEDNSRENFMSTLLAMREREDIRSYREWCRNLENAWRLQDIDRIYQSIQELQIIVEQIAASASTEPLDGYLVHTPNMELLRHGESGKSALSGKILISSCFSPSLVFLKNLGVYLASSGRNISMIENFLEHKLSDKDLYIFGQLQSRKNSLYSPGTLVPKKSSVQINTLEVSVGDTFNMSGNFEGAIVNIKSRLSAVSQTINKVPNIDQSTKDDLIHLIDELNETLQKVQPDKTEEAEAVAKSAELLVQTATREKPNRAMLQITADGLMQAAKNISGTLPIVAAITSQIINVVTKLVR